MMRALRLLPLLVVMLLQIACSSIDCPVENAVAVNYQVMAFDGTSEVADTLKDTLNVWSRRANGKDTLLLNKSVNAKTFSLQVSYTHPVDVLVFQVKDTLHQTTTDTVWVGKTDQPHFESVDCQASYFHTITNVRWTHNAIDSIAINNPNVNYDLSIEHFHLYLKADR